MKKAFAAIALAMMSIFLVGCYKEIAPDTSLAEKLMGKWVLDAKDDAPILTNSKIAYNYVSASKAYLAPVCELLDAALEENFCVSGNGTINDATEEDWGNF